MVTADLSEVSCNHSTETPSDKGHTTGVSFMRFRPLFSVSLAILAIQLPLQAVAPADTPTSVAIVELFTSEGCSSCPPADALLQKIHLKQTSSGQLIVGISEHVTYWNNLGWKDQYSDQTFTNRQEIYASRFSAEGPYTPQMVLNGYDQFVGSNGGALEQALRTDAHRKHANLTIVSATRQANELALKFSLVGAASKSLDIVAVLTDDEDRSNVLRGENSGRSLQHVSVARSLSRIATVNADTEQSVHVPLPEAFQRSSSSGHHLVLFAQEPHQGAIVGAAIMPI